MSERESKKRPVRKLNVSNFSVIKKAELRFGKITVLIGPQSSGKSLLCKLTYFLSKELVELAVTAIVNGNSWDEYLRESVKAFWIRFSSGYGLVSEGTTVSFAENEFEIVIRWGTDPNEPRFTFCERFRSEYERLRVKSHPDIIAASGASFPTIKRREVWITLFRIISGETFEGPVYIPAGRAFFTNAAKGFAALQNLSIDSITREFASHIVWDSRWKVGLLTTGRGVTDEIDRSMTDIAGGFVTIDSGTPGFLTKDGRRLSLEIVSTGIQELAPLFNVLEQLMYFREHTIELERSPGEITSERPVILRPLIYIEEPEAHIFPKTQYELIKLFSWLASDSILDFTWVITTHSPYVLSSFNNLILAGQLANEIPNGDEIPIAEKYWIKRDSFAAYSIADGFLKSILSDSGLIDGEYLDSVSEVIGSEFDSLLKLEYDHTKAS